MDNKTLENYLRAILGEVRALSTRIEILESKVDWLLEQDQDERLIGNESNKTFNDICVEKNSKMSDNSSLIIAFHVLFR